MFLLDLFRFCESQRKFTRQNLAGFVFSHKECDRLARHAGVTTKQFAALVAREFIPRLCTEGYLDLSGGVAWVKNKARRPFRFDLHSIDAKNSKYLRFMVNIEKMSDEELFRDVDKHFC